MPGLTVELEGADQLLRKLQQMPGRIAKGAMRKALISAAEVIAEAVRSRTPRDTGTAAGAVAVRSKAAKGPLGAAAYVVYDTQHVPELLRRSRRTGKQHLYIAVQHYRQNRFMTAATAAAHQNAITRILAVLRERIDRDFKEQ